jgi:hypothetical protein
MKNAGQFAGQKAQDTCTDSLEQNRTQTRASAEFLPRQFKGQTQDGQASAIGESNGNLDGTAMAQPSSAAR